MEKQLLEEYEFDALAGVGSFTSTEGSDLDRELNDQTKIIELLFFFASSKIFNI